jgi:hypothetical protein
MTRYAADGRDDFSPLQPLENGSASVSRVSEFDVAQVPRRGRVESPRCRVLGLCAPVILVAVSAPSVASAASPREDVWRPIHAVVATPSSVAEGRVHLSSAGAGTFE